MRFHPFAIALGLIPSVLTAQATNPGPNTRAYVSLNQIQNPACATAGFVGGPAWATTPSVNINCTGSNWSGASNDMITAGTITTSTIVTAAGTVLGTAPSFNNARSLTALSRAGFQDALYISSTGVIPTSVRFNFVLSGFVHEQVGANTSAGHTANYSVGFGLNGPANAQNVILGNGPQSRTVAYNAAWADSYMSFTTEFLNFSNLFATTDYLAPISGVSETSYTLSLTNVQFLDAQGNDVTGGVNAQFQSGAGYNVTPEPASMALLGTGLVGVGAIVRRRRARA